LQAGGWPKLYSVCAPSGTKHEFDDTSGFSGSDTEVGSFPSSRCCLSKAEYCWRVTSSSFDRFSKLAGSEPLSRTNSCRIDRSRIIRSSSSSRVINSARHNFLTASCRSTLPPRARQISRRSSRSAKPVPAFYLAIWAACFLAVRRDPGHCMSHGSSGRAPAAEPLRNICPHGRPTPIRPLLLDPTPDGS